jgi:hypothetical protein
MTKYTTLDELRDARNIQLQQTDHLLLLDHDLSETGLALLLLYRQQLRDLTELYDDVTVVDAVVPPPPALDTLYKVKTV